MGKYCIIKSLLVQLTSMTDVSKFSQSKLQCLISETQIWLASQNPWGGDYITVMWYRIRQTYLHHLKQEEQRQVDIMIEWRGWLQPQWWWWWLPRKTTIGPFQDHHILQKEYTLKSLRQSQSFSVYNIYKNPLNKLPDFIIIHAGTYNLGKKSSHKRRIQNKKCTSQWIKSSLTVCLKKLANKSKFKMHPLFKFFKYTNSDIFASAFQ